MPHLIGPGARVHCPGRGPKVPTLKALYLPLKYRHPVICQQTIPNAVIGAFWGWLACPLISSTSYLVPTSKRTSNRTAPDSPEQTKVRPLSLFGLLWDWISGSLAMKMILRHLPPQQTNQVKPDTTPQREKRSVAIFDLVARALNHSILPGGLIKDTD